MATDANGAEASDIITVMRAARFNLEQRGRESWLFRRNWGWERCRSTAAPVSGSGRRSPAALPLPARLMDGAPPIAYWSTDISSAKIDDQYKFVLTSPYRAGLFWKNDPYVRS